jgi:hypothetical protein
MTAQKMGFAWLRKYCRLVAVVVLAALTAAAYLLFADRDERKLTELEACQRKCASMAGALEGQRGLPNASPTDRRNHTRSAQCICR